jgi:hypothetical protein
VVGDEKMKTTNKADAKFNVTDKFKKRALELLDESQAMQFAEGLRLNRSASVVFAREVKRLTAKYGANDPRTVEMAVRFEASETAKVDLFARYVDVVTPPTTAKEGWAVDGFVRTADGVPVGELTVAPCDKEGTPVKGLGSAMTDARGFFSIKLDTLPKEPPNEVFIRAFKGRRVLESKEVRLVPEDGATERVEIILAERFGGGKPPEPTQPGTGTATPPIVITTTTTTTTTDKPPTGTTQVPDKPVATGTTPAPDKPVTTGTTKPAGTGAIPVKPSTTVVSAPILSVPTSAVTTKPKKRSTSKSSGAKSKPAKTRSTKSTAKKKTAAKKTASKKRTSKKT